MSNAQSRLVADRYRLIEPLGQGGMGRVWKARDEVLHRDVAIKELVPPPGLTDEERQEMRERSLREARAIARLNHINVVRVFDVLRTDGDPWIVMEYVPSRSLHDVLSKDGPVTPVRAAEIGLGVLGALKAAHRAGVMHRDIKPGNVLLGDDGRVVLTDFGLATIPGDPTVTRTGLVLGSPAYIAPERARDGTAGPRADLWSLGAMLYAAVEGQSPFARATAIATLAALATEQVPPPKNAGPLKGVLAGLLRKDPEQRMTADEAERQLRRIVHRRPRGGLGLLDGARRPGPDGTATSRTGFGRSAPAPAPRSPSPVRGAASVGGAALGGASAAGGTAVGKAAAGNAAVGKAASVGAAAAGAAAGAGVAAAGVAGTATEAEPRDDQRPAPDAESGAPSGTAPEPAKQPAGADSIPETGTVSDTRPASDPSSGGTSDGKAPDKTSDGATAEGETSGDDAPEAAAAAGKTADGTAASAVEDDAAVTEPATDADDEAAETEPTAGAAAAVPVEETRPKPAAATAGTSSTSADGAARTRPDATRVDGVPALGRAPITVPPPDPGASTRRRPLVLASVLVLALVVGLVAYLVLRHSGGGGQPAADPTTGSTQASSAAPATAGGSPSAGPSSAAPTTTAPSPTAASPSAGGFTLPAGWHMYTDPTGFKVPVPDGWRKSTDKYGNRLFNEPNGYRMLLIGQTRDPKDDPVADWKSQEAARRGDISGYQHVTIHSVKYWKKCADWEWLQNEGNARIHVRNRGFVTAHDQAYALRWDTRAEDWDRYLPEFDNIVAKGFVPARQD